MPEPWPYFADAANAAPVIWNDHGYKSSQPAKVWFFWGFPRLIGAPPFAYMTSTDNGASWSQVSFPNFPEKIGRYVSQPINSIVRATTANGTILYTDRFDRAAMPDGNGSVSAVWATQRRWQDLVRHRRHEPRAGIRRWSWQRMVRRCWDLAGRTRRLAARCRWRRARMVAGHWVKSKTDFDELMSGERPSVIRLKEREAVLCG